jgi:SNF2 family DNA or RNA helicase
MRICNPGLLGSLARFNERFATPIERDRDRGAQRTLKRLIAPFILRRTKAAVLDDLPPRTELAITVQPEATERAHYEALRRQAIADAQTSLAQGGSQAQINVLAQLTRLRRAACDPRLVSPELGLAGAKVQASQAAAELDANGHKALVFSQFVDFAFCASLWTPQALPTSTSTAPRRQQSARGAWPRSRPARVRCFSSA